MKTLLLTLALVTLSWSQVKTRSMKIDSPPVIDSNTTYMLGIYIEKTIAERWDEYVAQNYRMDTAVSFYVPQGRVPPYKWERHYNITKRQNLNSFNGFIEYLRRKQ